MGDSVGRWVDNTLVVDTTNLTDEGGFFGDAGGNFVWDPNLHLVDRFSMWDGHTLLYEFEIDDQTAFTRPWKGELTMSRSAGHIYEYACHERQLLPGKLAHGVSSERTEALRSHPNHMAAVPRRYWPLV